MNRPELLDEILRDTAELVKKSAHPKRATLALSPEVAALYERTTDAVSEGPSPDLEAELDALANEVSACTKCGLCEGRTQTVFADGSSRADLVFVGEAPGENEDRQGVPFVGRAGELLTQIITGGMKMQRADVYICNVIKCRPPNNRDPKPDEKAACEPYLIRQLELIQPKVICALGRHAANSLLKNDETTGKLRGSWHFYQGIPLRVTYHPAYLLRSPSEKRKTWADIKEVMKVLNGEYTPEPPPAEPTLLD